MCYCLAIKDLNPYITDFGYFMDLKNLIKWPKMPKLENKFNKPLSILYFSSSSINMLE